MRKMVESGCWTDQFMRDILEQIAGSAVNILPTWLVSHNDQMSREIRLSLEGNPTLRFMGAFSDGRAIVEQIKNTRQAAVSVVLVDHAAQIPGPPSWAAVLKELSSDIFILALMDSHGDEPFFSSFNVSVDGYLAKPCTAAQISSAVTAAVNGGITMSAPILRRIMNGARGQAGEKKSFGLSRREGEVVRLLVEGKSVKEIAGRLSISYNTADTHLKNIRRKLGVTNSRSVISLAIRERIVGP